HRIVPRQHDHHRPELCALRAAGDVRQELQHVRTHGVVGEVVLHTPHGLEAERLGEIGQPQLVAIDVTVGAALLWILEDRRHSNVHAGSPLYRSVASTSAAGGLTETRGAPLVSERLRMASSLAPGGPVRQRAGGGYNARHRGPAVSDVVFLVTLLGAAAGAGVLGAILGLGGGILLVPILTLFFGVSLPYAMGASIVSVIATSCGAAAGHRSSGLANIRLGLFLALFTVTGALAGASLVGVVPPRALQALFGLALGYSAFTTIRQLHVEAAESLTADPLAQRFGLDGVYHDQLL